MAHVRKPAVGTVVAFAVLVVLVAACALTYQHFAYRLPDLDQQTVAAAGEEGRLARDGLALADFGDSEGYAYVRSFDQVVSMKFLSDKEIAAFRSGQPGAARATVADTRQGRVVAVVVKMADPATARATAAALDQLQLDTGMQEVPSAPGVHRAELRTGQAADGRAHYADGRLLVRVDLEAAPGTDLEPAFTQLIDRQLRELPADG
ncbi:hypothetical protein LWP59_06485 [Amycolatopsis acidiphila]|uniref:Uncharacterized protein n=1 Tax=Amycolatopsis acidiphila TaxID=715473 RepID=A0A558AAH5_9PSEU|nr:hypothetical protein [Amycolatopsis acidiphila]TVT21255.1 hypothetical protein FNH06_17840 [Amycolatopsis acidiphila]UIJ61275.1 hypothetical protein LWP59_06485 [Amycolatopsis acidiphila]GHG78484.1 hypothetical protein GCM10017788_45690 [Amycolatopsis acidiphila]